MIQHTLVSRMFSKNIFKKRRRQSQDQTKLIQEKIPFILELIKIFQKTYGPNSFTGYYWNIGWQNFIQTAKYNLNKQLEELVQLVHHNQKFNIRTFPKNRKSLRIDQRPKKRLLKYAQFMVQFKTQGGDLLAFPFIQKMKAMADIISKNSHQLDIIRDELKNKLLRKEMNEKEHLCNIRGPRKNEL